MERARQRAREWYAANKDRAKANVTTWQSQNAEKVIEYKTRHAEANREQINDRSREYRKNNPEKRLVWEQTRRSRKAACGGRLSTDIVPKLMELQRCKCAACRADLTVTGKHLDHMVALSAGGTNTDDNVQLLCPDCNVRKGAKHPVDFMQQRGYLL
jgi:5-methylcytosine-specific restriction endonuclease McrA